MYPNPHEAFEPMDQLRGGRPLPELPKSGTRKGVIFVCQIAHSQGFHNKESPQMG